MPWLLTSHTILMYLCVLPLSVYSMEIKDIEGVTALRPTLAISSYNSCLLIIRPFHDSWLRGDCHDYFVIGLSLGLCGVDKNHVFKMITTLTLEWVLMLDRKVFSVSRKEKNSLFGYQVFNHTVYFENATSQSLYFTVLIASVYLLFLIFQHQFWNWVSV